MHGSTVDVELLLLGIFIYIPFYCNIALVLSFKWKSRNPPMSQVLVIATSFRLIVLETLCQTVGCWLCHTGSYHMVVGTAGRGVVTVVTHPS